MSLNYRSLDQLVPSALNYIQNPPRGISLNWWPRFTEILGGLRPNELTLVCAPTGAGKTAWLANVSAQLLHQGIRHFVAPVETGDEDYMVRVLSALRGKDYNGGHVVDMFELEEAKKTFSKFKGEELMYVSNYDNRVEVDEMVNMLTHMSQAHGCKVAILDNLNFFLKVVGSGMEKAEMDNAIHEFVMLVKKLPMHIFLVVHPRKTVEGRVESEFDIKGSSTAVQECANVMLFNRPKTDDLVKGNKTNLQREFVFKKIRKRGFNVNKARWFVYEHGRYLECQ